MDVNDIVDKRKTTKDTLFIEQQYQICITCMLINMLLFYHYIYVIIFLSINMKSRNLLVYIII